MKRFTLFFAFALAAVSCNIDDAEPAHLEELGLTSKEVIAEAEAGLVRVPFYANKGGSISFADGSWARASESHFSGDSELVIEYDDNEGFRRMDKVILSLDGTSRKDTLLLKQKGTELVVLESDESGLIVYNGVGETSVALNTNIPFSDLSVDIDYVSGESDWIKSCSLSNGRLYFGTEDNTSHSDVRGAMATLSYVDGWDEKLSVSFLLTQATADNTLGQKVNFEEIRALGVAGSDVVIEDNLLIEGYVVSDPESGNVNENPAVTMNTIDYNVCKSSIYLESLDGKYGFLLVTDTPEDNVLKANTRVQVLLKDATLLRYDNPERYQISGITKDAFVRSVAVRSEDIPLKKMHIGDLTDDDIYTRVELSDCEFPIRKGSISPLHEGYTDAAGSPRVSKAAVLIRDIEGNSMYVYTNTTCPYRRDGSRMGYGSGSMKGVVVHEKFRSFVDEDNADEDECGYIGPYQIRHMSKDDFDFADNFHNGFSEMICEWRYLDKTRKYPDYNNGFGATYGEGVMQHTKQGYINDGAASSATMMCAYGHIDFSYLGPIGDAASKPFGNNRGNKNGFGIILEDGTDYGKGDACTNADGRGMTDAACKNYVLCWGNSTWWDESKDEGFAWQVKFSTEGIETDHLSMQFAVLNQSQDGLAPRYWKAEWSADGSTWTLIDDFVVPDKGLWSYTMPSQSLQMKPIDMPLPLEMLGRPTVYIRLMPFSKLASDTTGYANAEMVNGKSVCTMDYFAVRYNK